MYSHLQGVTTPGLPPRMVLSGDGSFFVAWAGGLLFSVLVGAGWCWRLGKRGRRVSQLGTLIDSASRNPNRAGSGAGVRRVKDLWFLRKVTESGYPYLYMASWCLARSSNGLSRARRCSVVRERSRSILMKTPSISGSHASHAFLMMCYFCV